MTLKLRLSPLRRNIGEGEVSDAEPFKPKCWYRQKLLFPAFVKHGGDEIGVITN